VKSQNATQQAEQMPLAGATASVQVEQSSEVQQQVNNQDPSEQKTEQQYT
jgi:hypothetical protein